MKNFKKVLALVLVLASLMGLATVAGATEYKDADKISADYTEAVKVLDLIETMQGYPNGEFKPTANITREEAAKLIAIFDNKDADISTYYTSINPFADEKGRWGESYVGYGYRAGIIAGMNATTFAPTANVTGTQFLKMALVTLGYDQEAEGFVGSAWAVNVLALAKRLDLVDGLADGWKPEKDLTREEAAQILLNTLKADTVEYAQEAKAFGQKHIKDNFTAEKDGAGNVIGYRFNGKLYLTVAGAVKTGKPLYNDFKLKVTTSFDAFERPYTKWTYDNDKDKTVEVMKSVKASYTTKFNACDLLADLGVKKNDNETEINIVNVYTNGAPANGSTLLGKKHHGTSKCGLENITHGAQGTLTQVFDMGKVDGIKTYRVCSIDTWLAKVGTVTKKTTARDEHLRSTGSVKFEEIYSWDGEGFLERYCAGPVDENRFANAGQCATLSGRDNLPTYDDPTGLAKGDYVLLTYSWKTKGQSVEGIQSVDVVEGKDGRLTGHINQLVDNDPTETRVDGEYIKDAVHFHEGYSLSKSNEFGTYKFFYDAYGNVIGMLEATDTDSWGVVDKAWMTFPEGDETLNAKIYNLDAKLSTGTVKKFNNVDAYLDATDAGDAASINDFAYYVAVQLKNLTNGESSKDFNNMYDKLLRVSTDSEGKFTLKASSKVRDLFANGQYSVRLTQGKPYVEYQLTQNAEYAQMQNIRMTADTKILVHKMDGTYVSFTGYKNLESLIAHGGQYVLDDDDNVEVLYLFNDVYMTDGSFLAYVGSHDIDRTEEKNDEVYYGLKVYVDGKEQILYISKEDKDIFGASRVKGFYEFQVTDVDGVTTAKVESGPRGSGFKEVEKNLYWSKTIHNMTSTWVEIREDDTSSKKLYTFADDCKFFYINSDQTKVEDDKVTVDDVITAYEFSKTADAIAKKTDEHQGKAYIDFNSKDEIVAFYIILMPTF